MLPLLRHPPTPVPNELFLAEVFDQWQKKPDRVFIRDPRKCITATVDKFLRDVLRNRESILRALDDATKTKLRLSTQDVYIPMLAEPGYNFAVMLLAILSVGAAAVPLSSVVLPEEAKYFLGLCHGSLLLAELECAGRAKEITDITSVPNLIVKEASTSSKPPLHLLAFPHINSDRAGLVTFTSGSTGKPKGVQHSRTALYKHSQMCLRFYKYRTDDLFLITRPMHWMGGMVMLLTCLVSGTPMELATNVCTPAWFWKRMQAGDVTLADGTPSHLDARQRELESGAASWSPAEYRAAMAGIRKIRCLSSGSVPVSSRTKAFWAKLRDGRPLCINYGTTETMHISSTNWTQREGDPPGCVGIPLDEVDIKIDGEEEGEVLIKCPAMFDRYLSSDRAIMENVFTEGGYYRTGDIGVRDGALVYILGRASQDIIRFGGWKVFAPEVEEHLLRHNWIEEAWVVPVHDEHSGQRVAALISTQDDHVLTLKHVRKWLAMSQGMYKYKLPTVLRRLKANQEVPLTHTGKPNKKAIVRRFFDDMQMESEEVQIWDLNARDDDVVAKAFDWAGIQAS